MKIVIAPNAFKGSLTAAEAADSMEKGIKKAFPQCETVKVPVADGGDGLLDIIQTIPTSQVQKINVSGPLLDIIPSEYCFISEEKSAVIEMAKASGLALLTLAKRDATRTSTFGTGELIKAALDKGAKKIYVGIGGSATCDGGIGLASALGVKFFDDKNNCISPVGGELINLRKIDMSGIDQRLNDVDIEVICDVDNPLYGKNGAAYVYGPQKGATPQQVKELDNGLINLRKIIQRDLDIEVATIAGGGAAGGVGAGLYAFCGAELKPGIDIVLKIVDLHKKIKGAHLVLTAEGQIDNQTIYGKAPAGVAKLAQANNISCIALAGGIGENISGLYQVGIDAVFSICSKPLSIEEAMKSGSEYLKNLTEQVVRAFFAGNDLI